MKDRPACRRAFLSFSLLLSARSIRVYTSAGYTGGGLREVKAY